MKRVLVSLFSAALAISPAAFLAGCSDENSADKPSGESASQSLPSSVSDSAQSSSSAITLNQPVEQLAVHGDVPLSENEKISSGFVVDDWYYFSVSVRGTASLIYPTVREYKYDFMNGDLELLKERDEAQRQAVDQFFEFNGVFYEAMLTQNEDGTMKGSVLADGNVIWEEVCPSQRSAPAFTIDGDSLYVMTHSGSDFQSPSHDAVYQINSDLSLTLIWESEAESGFGPVKCVSECRDRYGKLVFQSTQNDVMKIVVIQDGKFETFDYDNQVNRFVPLSDEILVINRINTPDMNEMVMDSPEEVAANEYHSLSLQTGELRSLSSDLVVIGNKIAEAGALNDFLFIYAGSEYTWNSTWKATIEGDRINVEEIPEIQPGLMAYWRLNDDVALANTLSTETLDWASQSFYLVKMAD